MTDSSPYEQAEGRGLKTIIFGKQFQLILFRDHTFVLTYRHSAVDVPFKKEIVLCRKLVEDFGIQKLEDKNVLTQNYYEELLREEEANTQTLRRLERFAQFLDLWREFGPANSSPPKLVDSSRTPLQLENGLVAFLCNSHLSEADAELLTDLNLNMTPSRFVSEYGFVLAVFNSFDLDRTEMKRSGFSQDLCDLLDRLQAEGFNFAIFDRDADEVEGLKTFDW